MRILAGLRVTAGILQKDAAATLGVSQSALSMWENGTAKPSIDKISILARMYGCSEMDVLNAFKPVTASISREGA
jgi:transcriptional regulator with XRE-family HTH domain